MLLFALRFFKVQTTTTTTSMVMFDSQNVLRKYENVLDVMREFYDTRLDLYRRRKVTSYFYQRLLANFHVSFFVHEGVPGRPARSGVARARQQSSVHSRENPRRSQSRWVNAVDMTVFVQSGDNFLYFQRI